MQSGTHNKTGITTLCTVALLLTTAIPSYGGAITDSFQSIAEQAWMNQYIPRSDEETLPLTDYDNFEVTELFRAETIEDLEASLTDGYPMPWLEEVLKDETIPWEDRYWLDCRVRATIAQNTHTFFNPAGNPVHIDADAVFPGELYWREHMIVNPAESVNTNETERPIGAETCASGMILNSFGRKAGNIAVPAFNISTSRSANVSVYVSGGHSIYNRQNPSYACFMYPNGTFVETLLEEPGQYSVAVSQDGSTVVLSCYRPDERSEDNTQTPVYVFDEHGSLQRTIIPSVPLDWCWRPTISSDGQYLCHTAYGVNTCLIDCWNGTCGVVSKPVGFYDRYTGVYNFSPDDGTLCLGGSTTGRILNMSSDQVHIYTETEPLPSDENTFTIVCCSNDASCTTLTTRRSYQASDADYLTLYVDDSVIYSCQLHKLESCLDLKTDISPGGYFLFVNPSDDFCGYPSARGYADVYNLPLIVMQIEGR
ncbi:MAG: hypothetical protein B1H09_01790 [Gemmatimonadaceae bacterium 4484_173]|nr:MAG: hypothetical protein B1H09_01790 [Gemmatimonadaceae bacterium 4484_173]